MTETIGGKPRDVHPAGSVHDEAAISRNRSHSDVRHDIRRSTPQKNLRQREKDRLPITHRHETGENETQESRLEHLRRARPHLSAHHPEALAGNTQDVPNRPARTKQKKDTIPRNVRRGTEPQQSDASEKPPGTGCAAAGREQNKKRTLPPRVHRAREMTP